MKKTDEEETRLVRRAIEALGIDVPVLAWRVVGSRVELYLYGGRVVSLPAPELAKKRKK